MFPHIFTIPGIDFPLRSFGLMVAAGFLIGITILERLARRHGDDPAGDPERYGKVSMWILGGIVVGARAFYVVVEILRGSPAGEEYLGNPLKMIAVWEGGLVMYGGMLGGMIFGLWCAKREKLRIFHALDLGLTAAFFGQAIGRVGCLLVGDDYGRVVPEKYANLPFPITVRVPEVLRDGSLFGAENAGKLLYATQIWMSVNALLLGLLGLYLISRRRYAGQVSLILILLYAITRSAIEHFRGDSVRGTWFGDAISTSQLISIVAGVVAIALMAIHRSRRDKPLQQRAA